MRLRLKHRKHLRTLWLTTGVVLIAAMGVWLYASFFAERANPSAEEYPLRGIDISAHNGEIDFSRLYDDGVRFAYIKATEGADFIDRRYHTNANGLARNGIPAGAYHFFRFDRDGEMQAWNFIHALRGRNFLLPPAIDVEEWGNADDPGTKRVQKELRRMIALMQKEGYNPIVYTNKKGYRRYVRDHFTDVPLWICSFTDPPIDSDPSVPWALWQFSHRGSVQGISGPVDLNTIHPSHPLFATINAASVPEN